MTVRLNRRWLVGGGIGLLLAGVALLGATSDVCLSAWLFKGVKVSHCPDGRFRQTVHVSAEGLAREATGEVRVWALARGLNSKYPEAQLESRTRRLEASLVLVDAGGKETPLAPEKGWVFDDDDSALVGRVKLPALPDGDYTLRARVTTPLGEDTADAALPLYAPARVHVLTDRPLYEPGHRVQFRAVVLRAKDLAPLDGRPGTWTVEDPSGEVVLEERIAAGPWGVVSGTFPLDTGAPTGRWVVRWRSGGASGEAPFQVEPFTLPRFRVEAQSPRPFWRVGETPSVEGQVAYSSGAPVANAEVAFGWTSAGAWPAPQEWFSGVLPQRVKTDAAGRFKVTLPAVPYDLRGQATLSAALTATDAAGDRVQGGVTLLLSEDAIAVSAVTELVDGLVESFNNRVYLRATTADGRVLPGAELTVKRAWDPKDAGVRAVTDEDGVAALQFDPGVPVNVVVPPMPVRRPPPPPPVSLTSTRDWLRDDEGASLEDQLALERWVPSLFPCARLVSPDVGSVELQLGVRVGGGGAVAEVVGAEGPIGRCVAEALRARSLAAGPERLLTLGVQLIDPGLPTLGLDEVQTVGGSPVSGIEEALVAAALDARTCLPPKLEVDAALPVALTWRVKAGRPEVAVSWVSLPKEEGTLSAALLPCIQARFTGLTLASPEEGEAASERKEALGIARFTARPAGSGDEESRPQATTLLGYELKVSARVEGKESGSTKLILRPAQLPPTRLRATPVLARAGEEVRIELLRGPGYEGTLPEKLFLQAGGKELESKVDKQGRVARFRLPADFEGWAEARWEGALARVYVAPRAQLSVEVAPEKPAYSPGELARLQVRTRVDGKEGPAAVGLFGVDETLAQLAPLPGAEALGTLKPAPAVSQPAFGVLDGQALAMGRIRGANAAAAALLRVSAVPTREELEAPVAARGSSRFAPDVELTDTFYRVLAELATQVRAWEERAPAGETLSPSGMAKLWEQALAACEQRGEPVTDAYGRRLRLSLLPEELLALTDPRVVVVSGTRLSEDVENWGAWVAREAP